MSVFFINEQDRKSARMFLEHIQKHRTPSGSLHLNGVAVNPGVLAAITDLLGLASLATTGGIQIVGRRKAREEKDEKKFLLVGVYDGISDEGLHLEGNDVPALLEIGQQWLDDEMCGSLKLYRVEEVPLEIEKVSTHRIEVKA